MSYDGFPDYLLTHSVDVYRINRTVSAGKPLINKIQVESDLPCLLESKSSRAIDLAQGWLDKSSYLMTWTKPTSVVAGDIVVHEGTNHVIKSVRRDLQGDYYTARLETEST